MSAFVCDLATIDAGVSAIYDYLTRRSWNQLQGGEGVYIGPVLVRCKADLQLLALRLHQMNVQAVDARYGERNPVEAYRFRYITAVDPIFGIKQLQCLRYQCSEGDVPECELYKGLTTVIEKMCESFVSTRPEYERAPWGCTDEHVNRGVVSLADMMGVRS